MSRQQVVISVLADTRNFARGMGDASRNTRGFGDHIKRAGLIAGAALAAAGAAVGSFAAKAARMASDLEQSMGGVESVFKENAEQIHEWARAAANAAGLTANEYNKVATLIGTYLKSAGVPMDQLNEKTNDLVIRGADLAAMFGGSVSEAVDAIGSALRGEFVPLRRYGVALSQAEIVARALADTGKTSAAALTMQEKALATQALIFDKSADAAGQFARESSTLAGQQERLRANVQNVVTTIGSAMLPAFTAITTAANDLVTRLSESEAFQAFIAGLSGFVTSLVDGESALGGFVAQVAPILALFSPLGLVLKAVTPVLPVLVDGLSQVAATLGGALKPILPVITGIMGRLVALLSAGLAAILPKVIPVLVAFAEVIGNVLAAVLPVAASLLEAVMLVLEALLPVLLPIISAVLNIVQAFLPLVTLLAGLIKPILEPLIKIIAEALVPILEALAPVIEIQAQVWQIVAGVLAAVVGWIIEVVTVLVGLATGSEDARKKVLEAFGKVFDFFRDLPKRIGGFFRDAAKWLVNAGKNIVDGLLKGLKNAIDGVFKWIGDIGKRIGDVFAGVLGIRSPSRVFAGYGRNIVQGLVAGLRDTAGLSAAMASLSADVAGGFDAKLDAPTGYLADVAGGRHYAITVQAIAPSAEVGRAVVQAIDNYERFGGRRR